RPPAAGRSPRLPGREAPEGTQGPRPAANAPGLSETAERIGREDETQGQMTTAFSQEGTRATRILSGMMNVPSLFLSLAAQDSVKRPLMPAVGVQVYYLTVVRCHKGIVYSATTPDDSAEIVDKVRTDNASWTFCRQRIVDLFCLPERQRIAELGGGN